MHFNYSSNVTCHGRWIRQICNLALADLPHVRAADGLVKKHSFTVKKSCRFENMEFRTSIRASDSN